MRILDMHDDLIAAVCNSFLRSCNIMGDRNSIDIEIIAIGRIIRPGLGPYGPSALRPACLLMQKEDR